MFTATNMGGIEKTGWCRSSLGCLLRPAAAAQEGGLLIYQRVGKPGRDDACLQEAVFYSPFRSA